MRDADAVANIVGALALLAIATAVWTLASARNAVIEEDAERRHGILALHRDWFDAIGELAEGAGPRDVRHDAGTLSFGGMQRKSIEYADGASLVPLPTIVATPDATIVIGLAGDPAVGTTLRISADRVRCTGPALIWAEESVSRQWVSSRHERVCVIEATVTPRSLPRTP